MTARVTAWAAAVEAVVVVARAVAERTMVAREVTPEVIRAGVMAAGTAGGAVAEIGFMVTAARGAAETRAAEARPATRAYATVDAGQVPARMRMLPCATDLCQGGQRVWEQEESLVQVAVWTKARCTCGRVRCMRRHGVKRGAHACGAWWLMGARMRMERMERGV